MKLAISQEMLTSYEIRDITEAVKVSNALRVITYEDCRPNAETEVSKILVGLRLLGEAVQLNQGLRTLSLNRSNVGDQGVAEIARGLTNNATLQFLHLESNQIGDQGATSLAQALELNNKLQSVYLDSNNIGSKGAGELLKALSHNSALRLLNLGNNKVGATDVQELYNAIEAFKSNSGLHSLQLTNNRIGPDSARALAKIIKGSTSLVSLEIGNALFLPSDNHIGDLGASALAEGLRSNSTLTELFLSCNQVGDQGVTALGTALKFNSTLKKLNLSFNPISSTGAVALADSLQDNKGLIELALEREWIEKDPVQIGNEGATAFAQALRVNTTLVALRLCTGCPPDDYIDFDEGFIDTRIGNAGAMALAEALTCTRNLLHLTLTNNPIDNLHSAILKQAAAENPCMYYLEGAHLDVRKYNYIRTEEAQASLQRVLEFLKEKSFTKIPPICEFMRVQLWIKYEANLLFKREPDPDNIKEEDIQILNDFANLNLYCPAILLRFLGIDITQTRLINLPTELREMAVRYTIIPQPNTLFSVELAPAASITEEDIAESLASYAILDEVRQYGEVGEENA
jgi:Ran GTPase-activating protein (RanGAP) involved in mRNA processing and transport